MLSP
ncbi:Pathogenesis-related thaumatin superfamily protein [Zea mays]|jgi:hypothetical protein